MKTLKLTIDQDKILEIKIDDKDQETIINVIKLFEAKEVKR